MSLGLKMTVKAKKKRVGGGRTVVPITRGHIKISLQRKRNELPLQSICANVKKERERET